MLYHFFGQHYLERVIDMWVRYIFIFNNEKKIKYHIYIIITLQLF